MRVFFAIPLPREWKRKIEEIQEELLLKTKKERAIPVDDLHLTLQFVGDVEETERLISACKKTSFHGSRLKVKGLGSFKRGRENLVFLELESTKELVEIQRKLRKILVELHIPFDKKKFKAHITMMRRVIWEEEGEFSNPELSFQETLPSHFCLYASQLHPEGAMYRCLDEFILL